jgi:hypothetical protein
MKRMQVFVLGVLLVVGALGCEFLSDAVESNPTPPTAVLVVPTLPPPTVAPVAPTQPGAQSVTISESDLNQQLNQNLPSGGEVSNVFLDLHEGNTASVRATIRLNSLTLQPNASLKASVVNNRVSIEVTQVSVGGFGVPTSMIEPQIANLKNMAERELNSQLATLEANTGFKLQSIRTTETDMTLFFAP